MEEHACANGKGSHVLSVGEMRSACTRTFDAVAQGLRLLDDQVVRAPDDREVLAAARWCRRQEQRQQPAGEQVHRLPRNNGVHVRQVFVAAAQGRKMRS